MRFSPVAPIHILEGLALKGREYIGDYFLLLAHDVLENAARYEKFFEGRKNDFIIMDNSVIELGTSCTAAVLLEAAKIVGANVVVVPDVLQDGQQTIEATYAFMEGWNVVKYSPRPELMMVPQGNDIGDYMRCVEQIVPEYAHLVKWIGIARNLTDRVFPTRRMAVAYLHTYMQMFRDKPKLHMLGFSENVEDDIDTCNKMRRLIQGIDSAVPLRATYPIGKEPVSINVGPRGNWWHEAVLTEVMADNVYWTRKWIGEL